ncbi:protein of unknown function [Methylocaldum szegediense]|uniref:Uncharacterized protein n=1 Tax=Methylocaldum szegediense TaxID=73780 RepID=A0ABM9I8Y8_9GAMM|nr:protein of unknown function [Methylocaldum szegediense]
MNTCESAVDYWGSADRHYDTACGLHHTGIETIARLENADGVVETLRHFLDRMRSRTRLVLIEIVAASDRPNLTGQLSALLKQISFP